MASLELYINKQLCEIESPESFSVYLKRQLLNPAELSTKDAQRSYDITLPATATNNAIFGYTNTEEVKGKFSQLYDAQLLVNGIKIFDGKFKISEITKEYYKGNLGIPAQKTVKDIFGEMKMNQAGEWLVPFQQMTDISIYNKGEIEESKYCFFPFVLYGLMPKESKLNGTFTGKELLDDSVNFHLDNFPPSINCLETIKCIFDKAEPKLNITGTAFTDERLKNLFMSYKNPIEYNMPWNYGKWARASIKGSWTNLANGETECKYYGNQNNDLHLYTVDMLHAANSNVTIGNNEGKIVRQESKIENNNRKINHTYITIPADGLYKIIFDAKLKLDGTRNRVVEYDGTRVVSSRSHRFEYGRMDTFRDFGFEVKLLRRKVGEDISYDQIGFDNVFYRNNLLQLDDNNFKDTKYFPEVGGVNFIDIKQNPYLLCGFSFGKNRFNKTNPLDTNGLYCNLMAKRYGKSWDSDLKDEQSYTATHCPIYYATKEEDNTVIYEPTSKYTVNLISNTLNNKISRNSDYMEGEGQIYQIVWLEKDEQITVTSNSDLTESTYPGSEGNEWSWLHYDVDFNLSIEAFRQDMDEWLQIDSDGTGKGAMKWDDDKTFLENELDLVKFLPSDMKINDWLEHFCKAFNLDLVQTGEKNFELNTKQIRKISTSAIIDLDKKANVNMDRKNQSLKIPAIYEVGYTVDKNEEGYEKSKTDKKVADSGDDGGGKYLTGSIEEKTIKQTSNFSYNWFKKITDNKGEEWYIPVISDKEVWGENTVDYEEAMKKKYVNKAQRFWYKKNKTFETYLNMKDPVDIALVSDKIEKEKPMQLDYKNSGNSILNNYFTLLIDTDNTYTIVECFLTPDEYNNIADSQIKFNGDLYYVAEVDGYDPLCKKKATLKLIRNVI
ncbi:hypothetical protein [Prevotella sp. 10(H)]|uniref:hypothetical protein n=1 Tax=Prevotella sp. 10(H) TaxID=1158294 RepID=UPI0004A6C75C|nr:hypothetical protein [Prevotella sp. 10(H)]